MRPFEVKIAQIKLDTIAQRVRDYAWFPAPLGEKWEYGTNTEYLRELCAYWLYRYDWRRHEAELNRYPQFVAEIDGLPIHFVHVRGEGDAAKRPLILTHGWPGSHYEFWGSIDKLAFPSKHGGEVRDAFDVVVPSLPGYGFSGRPQKVIGPRATAKLFNTLVTQELGYSRYVAQGGDWGSLVTALMGYDYEPCVAVHVNMITLRPHDTMPRTDDEKQWQEDAHRLRERESAYAQEQATKPQTLALALMDSPVGTAAWILEKFHGWSDIRKGGLEAVYTHDQLLTNIMIYLVTDSIATSVWYYRGRIEEPAFWMEVGKQLDKPVGVANFKGEPVFRVPPRSYVERGYNVVHWSEFDEGGHFAAMEKPDTFVGDVRKFARTIGY